MAAVSNRRTIQTMSIPANRIPPAIILDLDGTVADTLDDITNAVNYALDHMQGRLLDCDVVRGMIGDGVSTLMSLAGQTDDEAMVAFLVRRFREHYDENYLANTRLYDGAERFFSRCDREGVLPAILSNKPHEYTLLICDELLDRWNFGAILGAHDGLPVKPHPASALALADAMKRDPVDMFFVGDSVVDVTTAKAAGMRSVAVTWGFQDRACLRASDPDYLVNDFEQLWDVIQTSGTSPHAGTGG